jgi:chemotaxis signal transduction protein
MYVGFVAANRRWVLPAEQVAAVGVLGPVTRLPTGDPSLLGVSVHRGRVVALVAVDGAGLRDVASPRHPSHLILLRSAGGEVAVAAEELLGLKVEVGGGIPDGFELLALEGPRLAGARASA